MNPDAGDTRIADLLEEYVASGVTYAIRRCAASTRACRPPRASSARRGRGSRSGSIRESSACTSSARSKGSLPLPRICRRQGPRVAARRGCGAPSAASARLLRAGAARAHSRARERPARPPRPQAGPPAEPARPAGSPSMVVTWRTQPHGSKTNRGDRPNRGCSIEYRECVHPLGARAAPTRAGPDGRIR